MYNVVTLYPMRWRLFAIKIQHPLFGDAFRKGPLFKSSGEELVLYWQSMSGMVQLRYDKSKEKTNKAKEDITTVPSVTPRLYHGITYCVVTD